MVKIQASPESTMIKITNDLDVSDVQKYLMGKSKYSTCSGESISEIRETVFNEKMARQAPSSLCFDVNIRYANTDGTFTQLMCSPPKRKFVQINGSQGAISPEWSSLTETNISDGGRRGSVRFFVGTICGVPMYFATIFTESESAETIECMFIQKADPYTDDQGLSICFLPRDLSPWDEIYLWVGTDLFILSKGEDGWKSPQRGVVLRTCSSQECMYALVMNDFRTLEHFQVEENRSSKSYYMISEKKVLERQTLGDKCKNQLCDTLPPSELFAPGCSDKFDPSHAKDIVFLLETGTPLGGHARWKLSRGPQHLKLSITNPLIVYSLGSVKLTQTPGGIEGLADFRKSQEVVGRDGKPLPIFAKGGRLRRKIVRFNDCYYTYTNETGNERYYYYEQMVEVVRPGGVVCTYLFSSLKSLSVSYLGENLIKVGLKIERSFVKSSLCGRYLSRNYTVRSERVSKGWKFIITLSSSDGDDMVSVMTGPAGFYQVRAFEENEACITVMEDDFPSRKTMCDYFIAVGPESRYPHNRGCGSKRKRSEESGDRSSE